MTRKDIPLLLSCLCLIAISGGCIRNEFMLEAELPEKVNYTYTLSYYASDSRGGVELTAALDVRNGSGKLKGFTRNPALGWIFYGNSPLPAAIFYAGRGDKIRISGDDGSPLGWSIGGNRINDELTEWRLANRKLIAEARDSFSKDLSGEKARLKLNAAIAAFVKSHPESAASVLLLGVYFDASLDRALESELWKILEGVEDLDELIPLVARQDGGIAGYAEDTAGKIGKKDIVLQSFWTNRDTLRLGSGRYPVVMLCWSPDDEGRAERIDSLRVLASLRKDSLDLMIADVSLGPDSVAWHYGVRRDSLKRTLRAWSFRGLADPELMKLGVTRTPCWLVAGRRGEMLYFGPDDAAALRAARKTLKSGPSAD